MSPKEHQEVIHSIKSQIDLVTEEVAQAICEDRAAERALRKLEFLSNLLARTESQVYPAIRRARLPGFGGVRKVPLAIPSARARQ
jgi:hypothetical protein